MKFSKVVFSFATLALVRPNVEAADVSLSVNTETQLVEVVTTMPPTLSVTWDRIVQSFVVTEKIGPTMAAGAYGTMHTAMYDAWAHFVEDTRPSLWKRKEAISAAYKTEKNKRRAMTFAALTVLKSLFPSKNRELHLELKKQGMDNIRGIPRRIGRRAAHAVLAEYAKAYANAEETNFESKPFTSEVDLWSPEHIPIDDANGPLQQFLTPEFGNLKTFGIENGAAFRPPPPKPFLLVNGTVNVETGTIQVNNGKKQKVSRDMIGDIINREFIDQCEEVIQYSKELNDRTKLIAEFWEDGGGTSFPPGTWMTFGQYVSARDDHSLDDDARMFLALGNAIRDAAIASWNTKKFYFYARPVRAIRDLGKLGLIGRSPGKTGEYTIKAYSMSKQKAGKILATKWETYQTPGSHPSPPFPEYTSGHSSFSGAAAEVLHMFTQSDNFGASITIRKGESRFEPGKTPKEDITLVWDTFTDAADEAGMSRLHGGIHFMDGNIYGKEIGKSVGKEAFLKAEALYNYN